MCLADDPSLHPQTLHAMDRDKRNVLEELKKKYRGEEGERSVVLPLLEWFSDSTATKRDGTMILGQKSTLELVEQSMYSDLLRDTFQEPIDRKIATVEKVAEAVGLKLDTLALNAEAEAVMIDFVGQIGPQPVADMKSKIGRVNPPKRRQNTTKCFLRF